VEERKKGGKIVGADMIKGGAKARDGRVLKYFLAHGEDGQRAKKGP